MPALLNRTSIRPNCLAAAAATPLVCASSVTSTFSATAASPISATVPRAASRSTSATTTPSQRDATYDRGGKDAEDQVGALARAPRRDAARLHQTADRRQQARDHEHTDPDPVDRDARRAGSLEVPADGVHGAADAVI